MRKRFLILIAAGFVLAAAAAEASKLGSIVSTFPARVVIGGIKVMPTGMAYADGYLWEVFLEGYVAKRTHPAGSVVATYAVGTRPLYCLIYDGTYLWTVQYSTALKLDPRTLKPISSLVINGISDCQALAWDGRYFWASGVTPSYTTFCVNTSGSVVASYTNPYKTTKGMCYAGNLPGGARLFEGSHPSWPPVFYCYKTAGRTYDYRFAFGAYAHAAVATWDGEYLWTFDNSSPGGGEICCQVVAWEPDYAVAPASVGKVKALFR
jgi:hypothetical protein